jgi:hypothetical protein
MHQSERSMTKRRTANRPFAGLSTSPAFWLKCGALSLIAGYLAFQSATHAIANIAWQQNPELALRFVPDHPFALSLKADLQFAQSQSAASLATVEKLARQSLKAEPLNAVAVRLLGYVADARGDRRNALRFISQAQKLSRRDFGTQLWLIEEAVARGDKVRALYHYDLAMRTTLKSHDILFPTLTGALADPEVRQGLVPYVKREPSWLSPFLDHATATSDNPADVATMIVNAGGLPDTERYHTISNALLDKLAVKSQFLAYRQYYQSLPGTQNSTLQQAGLNKATINLRYPGAGWQIAANSAIGGTFIPAGDAGRYHLSAFADSGERGELMRKILFLKPGNYRFTAGYRGSADVPDAEVIWELQCLSDAGNRRSWSSIANVRNGNFATVQDFPITPDCVNQALVMAVAGGNGQQGVDFTVRNVAITSR